MESQRTLSCEPRTAGVGTIALALFSMVWVSVVPARAAEAPPPAVSPAGAVLALPKGKPVTVSGMTMKGGTPEKQPTAVTVSWDDDGMTVVFDCTDSAIAAEWAEARDSDKTWKDDSVGVLLDVGHHHVEANDLIMFKLSVAGGLQDCRGKERNIGFNVQGVTSEVVLPPVPIPSWRIMPVTPEQTRASQSPVPAGHWRGTIRIPWKGLGATPKEGDVWGVNFTRIDHVGKYNGTAAASFTAWAPFAENFEDLGAFGHLVFAAKDAPTGDGAAVALREAVRQAHLRVAKDAVNEGNVLTLDGKQAATATGFTVAKSGAAPKQATSATLTWDTNGLDVVFDCVDSGIVAEQKGRDNIKLWKDDSVYVWLDPGHTHNSARQLIMVQVSAGGECHDHRNGDAKFDVAGIVVDTNRTANGWRAHVQMPWKGLGTECPKPGDVWGLNLSRMDQPGKTDYAKMESSSWVSIPDGDATTLDRWGHVVFAAAGAVAPEAQQTIEKSHAPRRQAIMEMNP